MTENTLPGIVKIQMVRCADLQPHLMNQVLSGVPIAIASPSVEIKFFGKPSLTWEGSSVNRGRQEKSTLEFKTRDALPEGERLAFVVTAASGAQYLIGTREPRYPEINYSETVGAPDGDAAIRTYKISHIALKSSLPCVL